MQEGGKIPRGFPVFTESWAMIPQAEALRELTDTLVDVLQHESNVIATKTWSRGLIGEELYHDTSLSQREKIAKIIAAISSRVKSDKAAFDKFVGILRTDASLEYLAGKLLERSSFYMSQQSGACAEGSGGTPPLKDLLKELKSVASKWENLGIMLGIDSGILDNIVANNPKNCDNCLREMLKVWLKQVDPPPRWQAVVEALEVLGEPKLASELRQRYCTS